MFPKTNPTTTNAWKVLTAHYEEIKQVPIKQLFAEDGQRFSSYSLQFGDILFDYSKNNINSKTRSLLLELATECKLGEAIPAMFNGEKINGKISQGGMQYSPVFCSVDLLSVKHCRNCFA